MIVKTLCENPKLFRYYRPDLGLYLETDASGVAIGMENDRNSLYPIVYGSKTLTDAETRYANIERELLGVVGGLEKFHYFMFGRPVTVLTDHKPLIAISKKSLVNVPPRLQHLLLRLNNYYVDLTWIPGKEMIFSDHLSRNVNLNDKKPVEPTCEGLDLKIHNVFLNASTEKWTSLVTETDKDSMLSSLKN